MHGASGASNVAFRADVLPDGCCTIHDVSTLDSRTDADVVTEFVADAAEADDVGDVAVSVIVGSTGVTVVSSSGYLPIMV